jgi:hypothetical protein
VSAAPSVTVERQPCPRTTQSVVSDIIRAWPPARITLTAMHAEVAAILRSGSWRIVAVPASKIPRIGPMLVHPIDTIARGALRGAVNILPDRRVGAYALIFIDPGCQTPGH